MSTHKKCYWNCGSTDCNAPRRQATKERVANLGYYAGTKRKAPWTDFEGNDIHEGDAILHPSGERGVVCFWPHETHPADQWRVFYGEHGTTPSRLCLQIDSKGQAVVVQASQPAPQGEVK